MFSEVLRIRRQARQGAYENTIILVKECVSLPTKQFPQAAPIPEGISLQGASEPETGLEELAIKV
jgi:hypothetical protein